MVRFVLGGGFLCGGGGVGWGCVCMYIYIPPRSPKKIPISKPRSPEKIQFQTIDFLPPPCYNGSVKD